MKKALAKSGSEQRLEVHAGFSNLGLPDGSGIDLIQKLASKPPLGIALTGFGMEQDIRKSRDVGFQHHLVKPIDLNKLDSLIQEETASLSTV